MEPESHSALVSGTQRLLVTQEQGLLCSQSWDEDPGARAKLRGYPALAQITIGLVEETQAVRPPGVLKLRNLGRQVFRALPSGFGRDLVASGCLHSLLYSGSFPSLQL